MPGVNVAARCRDLTDVDWLDKPVQAGPDQIPEYTTTCSTQLRMGAQIP